MTKICCKISYNECLVDVKLQGNKGTQCVCYASNAEFRLTLSSQTATEFDGCWNYYDRQKNLMKTDVLNVSNAYIELFVNSQKLKAALGLRAAYSAESNLILLLGKRYSWKRHLRLIKICEILCATISANEP